MKEVKNKISIIVPVYNVEPFLRKCVYSLTRQTYENIEIILINDGSPDNCGKICDALAKEDKRIKVIHQENKGLCGARNAGLKAATGEYIGFVDSDDWVTPDMFEYLITNLKESESDISACRYFRVKGDKEPSVKTDGLVHIFDKQEAINELTTKFTIRSIFCNKLFKREIFNNITFPEGKTFEGTYMMHKLFEKAEKIIFLPEAKYYYYNFEESIVNTKNVKNQCCYIIAFIERYKDLHKKYPSLIEEMLKSIIKESLILLEICYQNKKEINENIELIQEIAVFINENMKLIKKQPYINKITIKKLEYYKSLKKCKLFLPHILRKLGRKFKKILKKYKKFIYKLFNKTPKKVVVNTGISLTDLTKEDKDIFNKLHKTQLSILDELDKVCKKNNLKYYLYGGTLLGAVRHKGFIPWDDDIDIIMPREDFDKLEKCCKKDLGKGFFLQTNNIEPNFLMLFAKIRKNNTYVREEKWDNVDLHQGIFIDILPLDLFPRTNNIKKRIILEKFNVLNCACQTGRCLSKHLLSNILYKYYMLFSNSTLQKKRRKYIKKLSKDKDTDLVCSFGSHYRPLIKRVLKREWFLNDDTKMEFEGKKYPVPNGWKEYLIHLFGPNYMELPPVEKRANHFNFYEVDFDKDIKTKKGNK